LASKKRSASQEPRRTRTQPNASSSTPSIYVEALRAREQRTADWSSRFAAAVDATDPARPDVKGKAFLQSGEASVNGRLSLETDLESHLRKLR